MGAAPLPRGSDHLVERRASSCPAEDLAGPIGGRNENRRGDRPVGRPRTPGRTRLGGRCGGPRENARAAGAVLLYGLWHPPAYDGRRGVDDRADADPGTDPEIADEGRVRSRIVGRGRLEGGQMRIGEVGDGDVIAD